MGESTNHLLPPKFMGESTNQLLPPEVMGEDTDQLRPPKQPHSSIGGGDDLTFSGERRESTISVGSDISITHKLPMGALGGSHNLNSPHLRGEWEEILLEDDLVDLLSEERLNRAIGITGVREFICDLPDLSYILEDDDVNISSLT